MIHFKRCAAFLAALALPMTIVPQTITAADSDQYAMNITVDLSGEQKAISPYIYGMNKYDDASVLDDMRISAVRQGGNRLTAYNWETNASNAGEDWKHSSDSFMSSSNEPAACAQELSEIGVKHNIPYRLTTLQMAGYVAADKDGSVSEAETAPSGRWNTVKFTKGSAFSMTPDLTDGTVYMDEYVNYIVNMLGDAGSSTGIQGYSLDNEPALWAGTHPRMHPNAVTVTELSEKSIELAKAVKSVDPKAEIFGPALYGYTAYDHLADGDDWNAANSDGKYHWYIDKYLDDMKQASDEAGVRLLDVLDIHYYTESGRNGTEDRLQSVRTLYEKGFVENSWIGQWCQENIPILPTIQNSIDTYYPGTKLAITEYNFGGDDEVSGAIAQAEALGCYADANVYFATLWGGSDYIFSGMKLYTNYDGNGGHFGDTLVPTVTDDVSLASSYSAISGKDDSRVTVMLTNKSLTDAENASIQLKNSSSKYQAAAVYAVYGDSTDIRLIDIVDDISGNSVNVTLPAYSAAMIVVSDDASDFEGLALYDPDKITERTETFTDIDSLINKNGNVEIPITDAANLKKIILTADVTSSAGSSYGGVGGGLCVDVESADGTQFWSSKTFSIDLGSGKTATVTFDGTFTNDEETVEAVIYDGKVEVQKWWDYSEKQEQEIADTLTMKITNVQVIYAVSDTLQGDVNADGKFDIADVVLLQKWLLAVPNTKLADWKAADLCEDDKLNVFDLCLMKRKLIYG